MKGLKLQVVTLSLFFILLIGGVTVAGLNHKVSDELVFQVEDVVFSDDFYFVHITDTHVLHRVFERNEGRKNGLVSLLEHINSFDEKPLFVVITGDLVKWGSSVSGALNYRALMECFYEKDNQYYTDSNYSIPVYFTPGNHDYYFDWNLINYHRFVDRNHILENDRYTVSYGSLSLFFLDSGPHYIVRPKDWLNVLGRGLTYWGDIRWLDDELSKSESQHKIVLMHYPAVNWGDRDVIAHNREVFIELCEDYDVDLVLTGHTHAARVFDKDKNFYPEDILPLNCNQYPTLHVQTDACKGSCYYRNISVVGDDVWLHPCEQASTNLSDLVEYSTDMHFFFIDILDRFDR